MVTPEAMTAKEGVKRRWWVWPLVLVICLVVGGIAYGGYRFYEAYQKFFGTGPWQKGPSAQEQIAQGPRLEYLWNLCRIDDAEILSVTSRRNPWGDADFIVELRVDDLAARLDGAEPLEKSDYRMVPGRPSLTGAQYLIPNPSDPECHSSRLTAIVPHGTDDRIVYHAEEYR